MKSIRNPSIVLLLAAGLLSANAAFPAPQPGGCEPMERWSAKPGQRAERLQEHRNRLHDALKLTSEQEGAWKKFTEATAPARPLAEMGRPQDWSGLTAPERADRMLAMARQHQERMASHVEALKAFYAVLSPGQKTVFDDFHRMPRDGRKGPRKPTPDAAANPA